ncbi:MAG: LysR family transcriptional regulator [Desulfobulbaceae bacterium]|mgnify:CR=1 FL=1|nr:MAG: LysR family transcriptional regulator [Desulfobulbaceae bacterium]
MDTRHLRIFTTIYRTRSFTKASQELFTSQPTVSEHMRNLEEQLGCKLFDRLGRSILPTAEAEVLYPRAIDILNELDQIEKTLSSVTNSVSGELLIGASTIPGAYIIPGYAALFKRKYPDVSYQILIRDSEDIINEISTHKLYLGIVGARTPSKNVEYTPFGSDELVLAGPANDTLPDRLNLSELAGLDFLIREKGSGTGKTLRNYLQQHNFPYDQLNVRAILGSSTAIKEAVKSGLGVAFISKTAIADDLSAETIKIIKVKGVTIKRTFFIVTPRKRTMPNHYLVFANSLKASVTGPKGVYLGERHEAP